MYNKIGNRKMKFMNYIIIVLLAAAFYACGDPAVGIEDVKYEPKITVEAYLYPGETVNKIKLTRNFSLETTIVPEDLPLTPDKNSVVATINGVLLSYNETEGYYYSDDLLIENNKNYKLEVNAVIDGQQLYTESETITPESGFHLLEKDLGDIQYVQQRAEIKFNPAPGTDFYAFSIRAENATLDNFIYDNPFIPDLERKDVEEDFNDYLFQRNAIINVNSEQGNVINYEINELDTWFYTNYKVIVYAGDKNFKDYFLTVDNVQQPDGNFIEPEFHFEGDGIGIFGSAIKDTLTFNLLPR